jgi:23S rRNA (uridine2552-2'-O)-methyltransferase
LSKEWNKQRQTDTFYRKAKTEGYRSRAAYKIKEIDNRLRLFKEGSCVIEIGASPGGWTQAIRERIGQSGKVVAVDLTPMPPLDGVIFVQGDITEKATMERILAISELYDVVVSDASPKLSGNKTYDRGRDLALCWSIMDLALKVLKVDGTAVIKMFQGEEMLELKGHFSPFFKRVDTLKPKSSLNSSTEVYLAFRFRSKGHGVGNQQSQQYREPSDNSEPQ